MSDSQATRYLRFRGRVSGPFAVHELIKMAQRGQLTRFHEISPDRVTWTRAGADLTLFPDGGYAEQLEDDNAEPQEQLTLRNDAPAEPAEWYYAQDDQQLGPVTERRLRDMIAASEIGPAQLIWRPGMTQWQPLASTPLFSPDTTQPTTPEPQSDEPAISQTIFPTESYNGMAIAGMAFAIVGLVTCLLGIILGPLGIIFSGIALKGMRRSGNNDGKGFAITGLIVGSIGTVLAMIVIVLAALGHLDQMVRANQNAGG